MTLDDFRAAHRLLGVLRRAETDLSSVEKYRADISAEDYNGCIGGFVVQAIEDNMLDQAIMRQLTHICIGHMIERHTREIAEAKAGLRRLGVELPKDTERTR